MAMLGKHFPDAQFLITGVLGPHSNAHGPNEFLHVPYAKKLTRVLRWSSRRTRRPRRRTGAFARTRVTEGSRRYLDSGT